MHDHDPVRAPQSVHDRSLVAFQVWRLCRQVVLAVVVCYVGLAAALLAFQSRLLYYPQREIAWTPKDVGLAYASVSLETADKVSAAIAALDRAVAKGVIHRNAASRRKSGLMKSLDTARKPAAS